MSVHDVYSIAYFVILALIAAALIAASRDNHRLNKMADKCRRKHKGDNAEVLNAIRNWRGRV